MTGRPARPDSSASPTHPPPPLDPRRAIPRTDALLVLPALVDAAARVGGEAVRRAVRAAQERARAGLIAPGRVADAALAALDAPASLRPVLNATGVVVHTNLGRAPLSESALAAVVAASGYTPLELDLDANARTPRGEGSRRALLAAVPAAEDALIVNNGAAALVLTVTALATTWSPGSTGVPPSGSAEGPWVDPPDVPPSGSVEGPWVDPPDGSPSGSAEGSSAHPSDPRASICTAVLISRGELVEIGDGFRVADLATSTGARLIEVGATNRTTVADYESALSVLSVACRRLYPTTRHGERHVILKVHPSNYTIAGFTGTAAVADLAALDATLVVDIGSGLLAPDPALPDEPDAASSLAAGADLVICSGDKLLGGPQSGLILGRADLIGRLRRHPLARALRVDKLTLAALEATLATRPPVTEYRATSAAALANLERRTRALASELEAEVVPSVGRVGGGGAPGVDLPGWALALPEGAARPLRTGTPAVLARVERGRCLVDLRCIPPDADAALAGAVRRALGGSP